MHKPNFLEISDAIFSPRIEDAISAGKLSGIPIVRQLEHAWSVSRGLSVLLSMVRANEIHRLGLDDEASEGEESALSANTVDCLLDLGCAATEMLSDELESCAIWAEKLAAKGNGHD